MGLNSKKEVKKVKNTFEKIEVNEFQYINGGAVAGAVAGAILGGTVGLVGGTAKGVVTGQLTGNELWKCYTTGALTGAYIGTVVPV